MQLIGRYWLSDRSVPFGMFLNFMEIYYSPDVRNDLYDDLVARARLADSGDAGMATFKKELVRLLKGDREGLHSSAIFTAAEYDEWDTDDEFLRWLWRELYPSELVPMPAAAESD
ncbi:hypothetical protein E1263_29715 [Kribbella antibiotica]|uniref:CdiI immunity protein domain-containing protein n=1 Tax=Kribbella antibiotica TaxID=190195 RepID=A0A4R4Z4B0_9ACTN|nr:hypothetical protein [Kribbella antibiotica]TDD51874.1 hypothetical protein E1263_29715 [Kribbella antibiotica]